jgi:hypothetical protein
MWPNRPKNLREHAAITHHRSEPEVEFVGGEGGMERGDRNRAAGIGARNATETKYNSPGGPVGIVIR